MSPRRRSDQPENEVLPGSAEPAPLLEDRSYLAYVRPTPRPFLNFASGHFPAGTVTTPHSHPCVALHGCLSGPLTLCTSDSEVVLEAGVFYLIGPGQRHSWRNDGRHTAATLSFLLDTAKPGRWPAMTNVDHCCQELQSGVQKLHRFTTSGDRELHQCFWQVADHLTAEKSLEPLSLTGALLSFLGMVKNRLLGPPPAATGDHDTAQEIRRLLLARVEDNLCIAEIARELATSPTRAKEAFREAFGCGIMTYFNQLKIWHAKRLLNDTSLSVEQVSQQLGFSTASYFSRTFLKHTGETPTAYRQSNDAR